MNTNQLYNEVTRIEKDMVDKFLTIEDANFGMLATLTRAVIALVDATLQQKEALSKLTDVVEKKGVN